MVPANLSCQAPLKPALCRHPTTCATPTISQRKCHARRASATLASAKSGACFITWRKLHISADHLGDPQLMQWLHQCGQGYSGNSPEHAGCAQWHRSRVREGLVILESSRHSLPCRTRRHAWGAPDCWGSRLDFVCCWQRPTRSISSGVTCHSCRMLTLVELPREALEHQ